MVYALWCKIYKEPSIDLYKRLMLSKFRIKIMGESFAFGEKLLQDGRTS